MKKSLKAEDIDCLRNYPRLPENLGDDDLEYQQAILQKQFPWGCSKLTRKIQFDHQDYYFDLHYRDQVNACTSIKYGVAYAKKDIFTQIYKKFQSNPNNLYVRIHAKQFNRETTIAIARVTRVLPDQTFRFWFWKDNAYPVGVIILDIIAVGRTPNTFKGISLEDCYRALKQTFLPWKSFRLSDEEEQKIRFRYIYAIEKSQVELLQKKVIESNRDFLQELKQEQNI